MTKRKPPSEWKKRPKEELVGGHTKVCNCGTIIHRNGMPNMAWIRKSACSQACAFKNISALSWKRARACN